MRIKRSRPNILGKVRSHVRADVRPTFEPNSTSIVRSDRSTFKFLYTRKIEREGVKTKKKFYGDKNRKTALTALTALTQSLISNHPPIFGPVEALL